MDGWMVLPGDIDCYILLSCTGQHPEELIEDGGQELDHHVTLHGVQTLKEDDVSMKSGLRAQKVIHDQKNELTRCRSFDPDSTFRYFTSSPPPPVSWGAGALI